MKSKILMCIVLSFSGISQGCGYGFIEQCRSSCQTPAPSRSSCQTPTPSALFLDLIIEAFGSPSDCETLDMVNARELAEELFELKEDTIDQCINDFKKETQEGFDEINEAIAREEKRLRMQKELERLEKDFLALKIWTICNAMNRLQEVPQNIREQRKKIRALRQLENSLQQKQANSIQ